jgi:hypothetical protein
MLQPTDSRAPSHATGIAERVARLRETLGSGPVTCLLGAAGSGDPDLLAIVSNGSPHGPMLPKPGGSALGLHAPPELALPLSAPQRGVSDGARHLGLFGSRAVSAWNSRRLREAAGRRDSQWRRRLLRPASQHRTLRADGSATMQRTIAGHRRQQ